MLCIDTDVIIGDLNKSLAHNDDKGVGLAIIASVVAEDGLEPLGLDQIGQ